MEKHKHYENDRIEICRNCGGTGVVEPEREWRLKRVLGLPREIASGRCQVCNGSGRVEKHTEINITIKPYGTEERQ